MDNAGSPDMKISWAGSHSRASDDIRLEDRRNPMTASTESLPADVYLVNPASRRFYRISACRDLLGHLTVTKSWGALDSARGGLNAVVCETTEAMAVVIANTLKVRGRRHYSPRAS